PQRQVDGLVELRRRLLLDDVERLLDRVRLLRIVESAGRFLPFRHHGHVQVLRTWRRVSLVLIPPRCPCCAPFPPRSASPTRWSRCSGRPASSGQSREPGLASPSRSCPCGARRRPWRSPPHA